MKPLYYPVAIHGNNVSLLIISSRYFVMLLERIDRLCGLVARVPGYRFRGPGSILGGARFSEKQWFWNGVHSAS
jgi:hypothetical protein